MPSWNINFNGTMSVTLGAMWRSDCTFCTRDKPNTLPSPSKCEFNFMPFNDWDYCGDFSIYQACNTADDQFLATRLATDRNTSARHNAQFVNSRPKFNTTHDTDVLIQNWSIQNII